MRDKLNNLFAGRQGMDEFSKFMFWSGAAQISLSCLLTKPLNGFFSSLLFFFGMFMLIFSFVRAFSRKLQQREMENMLYLRWLDKKRNERRAAKDRRPDPVKTLAGMEHGSTVVYSVWAVCKEMAVSDFAMLTTTATKDLVEPAQQALVAIGAPQCA